MNLPEYLEICPLCKGKGEREQSYNAGCGGGMYTAVGRCDFCQKDPDHPMKGLGFIMKDDSEIPSSVINQVKLMNKAA